MFEVKAYVRKDSVKALKNDDGDLTKNKEEISKILNDHFLSIFVKESDSNPPSVVKRTDLSLSVKYILKKINYNMVEEKLKKLKDSKAPTADGVHPLILKTCAESIAKPLKIIFEKSLKEGKLPEWWKRANVTPISKKGCRSDPKQQESDATLSVY